MGRAKYSGTNNESRRKKGEGGLRYRDDRGVWVFIGDVGVRPDGTRIRIERTGKTKAEARERFLKDAAEINIDYLLSQPVEDDITRQMPFKEFMITFIGKYKVRKDGRELESRTKGFYFYLAGLMSEIDDLPLDMIDTEVLQTCINRTQTSKYRANENDTNEFSERVMVALITLLRAAFRFGVKKGVVPYNYMEDVQRPLTKTGKRMAMNGRALSLPGHVVQKLLDALMQDPLCKVLITTMLYTGLRIGEVRALTHSSWNRRECSFMVDKSAVRRFEFENGKTIKEWTDISTTQTMSSVREIIYDESLNTVLDEWILYREKFKGIREHLEEHGSGALLFPGERSGKVLGYHTVYRKFHRILDAVDLGDDDVRFHRLRHTFATMLIDDKIDPKTVAEMLGHSSIVTTLAFYRTVTSDAKRKAASSLAGKFSSGAQERDFQKFQK